ncbi:gamma-glutamyltransferase [uncultured Flavobacterium sp.]|uniref:gamma-glutamyltransferase n=1 Tax=uncultured Flavobacterium sp. TaxID=165435 RepID=UPI0030CA180B
MRKIVLNASIVFFLFLSSCSSVQKTTKQPVIKNGMVVSAREEASKIGVEILKNGGNAFDAMIATEMALAVAYPYAGNLGGGGFMVYRKNNGEVGTLDFREKAPKASYKDMFLDEKGTVIKNKSTHSASAIGVPGTIAGIFAVHEKYGSLPMNQILKPVIELAKKGIVITKKQEEQLKKHQEELIFANGNNSLLSQTYKENDTIKYLQLAETLTRISKNGKNEFYKGETAIKLIQYISDHNGIMTLEDLQNYQPVWRKPVTFEYKNLKIHSMAPPSSGGITLGQILQMIEPFQVGQYPHNSEKYIQIITEAERRAYADRNHYIGDPDFVSVSQSQLLDKAYLKNRMNNFSFVKATPSTQISNGTISNNESTETTHYSIVDAFGNAVSVTTTLNGGFGSKLYCDELGFFLNNEMDDFSVKPGVPNSYGLIGGKANAIAPNKRMLSSMTPTIVEKNNQLFMVLGSPGGSTIITSILQTILNVSEYNMSMQQAVDAPRFHHQWLPDEIVFEPNLFSKKIIQIIKKLGYITQEKKAVVLGKVDAIKIMEDKSLQGGADHRGDDAAVGY